MELSEFVKDTLLAIVKGIEDAQQAAPLIPRILRKPSPTFGIAPGVSPEKQLVQFDVALGETQSAKAGGKIGVAFPLLTAEGGGAKSSELSSSTRVQFAVPMVFPATKKPGVPTGGKKAPAESEW